MDLAFYLLGSIDLVLCPLTLVNIHALAWMLRVDSVNACSK